MRFDKVIGQAHIKEHLKTTAKNGRVPHAQLFVGNEGCGTLAMALAYAQLLLEVSSNNPETTQKKVAKLQHPDLHFAFPVTTNNSVKKHPVSDLFLQEWRSFLKEQPYGNLFNWLESIGVENKQGLISVDEAQNIVKKLLLKSYEGGFKVMMIWMAEKMNIAASNKLLKLIEEPPDKTIFLLVTENEDQIINTIKSRCQALYFPALSENDIVQALVTREQLSENEASIFAHEADGIFNKALHILRQDANTLQFEQWFITWIRAAFRAKGNAAVIQDLVVWSSEIAKSGRETQKQFLGYCLQFFRQALLLNYASPELVFLEIQTPKFDLKNFAPFVHGGNIHAINKELNDALYHIERNGNAKIIFLDLSMKLTRFLHVKETPVG